MWIGDSTKQPTNFFIPHKKPGWSYIGSAERGAGKSGNPYQTYQTYWNLSTYRPFSGSCWWFLGYWHFLVKFEAQTLGSLRDCFAPKQLLRSMRRVPRSEPRLKDLCWEIFETEIHWNGTHFDPIFDPILLKVWILRKTISCVWRIAMNILSFGPKVPLARQESTTIKPLRVVVTRSAAAQVFRCRHIESQSLAEVRQIRKDKVGWRWMVLADGCFIQSFWASYRCYCMQVMTCWIWKQKELSVVISWFCIWLQDAGLRPNGLYTNKQGSEMPLHKQWEAVCLCNKCNTYKRWQRWLYVLILDALSESNLQSLMPQHRFASDWWAKSPQRSASSGLPRGVFDILQEDLYIQSTLSWSSGLRCSSLVAAKHLIRKDIWWNMVSWHVYSPFAFQADLLGKGINISIPW